MSLQLRLFGGSQSSASKLSASNDGSHAIDKSKVLAQTDAGVITPNTPGNFSSIRSVPVVPDPRYFTKEEADAMKGLAKEKTDGAGNLNALTNLWRKLKRPTRLYTRNIGNMKVPSLKMSWARSAPMLGWLRSYTDFAPAMLASA
jgi:hypothetical protein